MSYHYNLSKVMVGFAARTYKAGARDGWNHPGAVAPRAVTPGTSAKLPAGRLGFLARAILPGPPTKRRNP